MKLNYVLVLNLVLLLSIGCSKQPVSTSTWDTSSSQGATVETPTDSSPSNSSAIETSSTPDPTAETSPPSISGSFVAVDHPTVGEVKLVTEGDRQFLEFSEDFKTDAGPDLVVVLHRSPQIQTSALNESDYFALAPLNEIRGSQRYALPEDIDRQNFGSVAIWCRQFNVTFGYAKLK